MIRHRHAPGEIGPINSLAIITLSERFPEPKARPGWTFHAEQFDLYVGSGRGMAGFRPAVVAGGGESNENLVVGEVVAFIRAAGVTGAEAEYETAVRGLVKGEGVIFECRARIAAGGGGRHVVVGLKPAAAHRQGEKGWDLKK